MMCPLCGGSIYKTDTGFNCPECNTEFDSIGNVVGEVFAEDIEDLDLK